MVGLGTEAVGSGVEDEGVSEFGEFAEALLGERGC